METLEARVVSAKFSTTWKGQLEDAFLFRGELKKRYNSATWPEHDYTIRLIRNVRPLHTDVRELVSRLER